MFKGEVAASVLGVCNAVHLCFGYPEDVVGLPGISMVRGSSDRVSQLLKCRCYVPLWWYSGYHVLTLCFQSKFISSANYGIKRKFPKIYLIYSSFLSHSFPLSLFEFHTHVILFSWFKHTISHLISSLSPSLSHSFSLFSWQVLPVVVYFYTVTSVLYYLGVMQVIVKKMGMFLSFCLGTSPAESLNAAGNIFVGMVSSYTYLFRYFVCNTYFGVDNHNSCKRQLYFHFHFVNIFF